ncbi:hypothetical protein C8R43DRAFT_666470 [Mycena crocata]|nr:hypothetical protein C8R43DRAFT_666470 [Mycena crocata]
MLHTHPNLLLYATIQLLFYIRLWIAWKVYYVVSKKYIYYTKVEQHVMHQYFSLLSLSHCSQYLSFHSMQYSSGGRFIYDPVPDQSSFLIVQPRVLQSSLHRARFVPVCHPAPPPRPPRESTLHLLLCRHLRFQFGSKLQSRPIYPVRHIWPSPRIRIASSNHLLAPILNLSGDLNPIHPHQRRLCVL